jgi:hypothetical protein
MGMIHKRIKIKSVIVVKPLDIEANSLAVTKSLLHANIHVKLTSASLCIRLNLLAINFCSFASVLSLLLVIDALEHCPFRIC